MQVARDSEAQGDGHLAMRTLLLEAGLVTDDAVECLSNRTRDSEDVRVMRCPQSEIIFLEGDIGSNAYYLHKPVENDDVEAVVPTLDGEIVSNLNASDLDRRLALTTAFVDQQSVLDFGCGAGIFLDAIKDQAATVAGIEINDEERLMARAKGLDVRPLLNDLSEPFDTVTMFHTLEHLHDPIGMLRQINKAMPEKGTIIVEVPHARDFLIKSAACDAYKNFTFWREHLILHTRESLQHFLSEAEFADIEVSGCQRYGLENHLHWLATGEPNGHSVWQHFSREGLNHEYAAFLADIDQTDTLVAVAKKS